MSIEVIANLAQTSLSALMGASTPGTAGFTFSVTALGGFPNGLAPGQQCHAIIEPNTGNAEIILVTAMGGAGNLSWTCTRGVEGLSGNAASATSHAGGSIVMMVATSGVMAMFPQLGTNNVFTGTNEFQSTVYADSLVGVGTTSPDRNLHVVSTGTEPVHFTAANFSRQVVLEQTGANSAKWGLGVTSNTFNVYDYATSLTRLTVGSTGRVGVGTTTPSDWLHVKGDNTTDTEMIETGGGTPNSLVIRRTDLGPGSDLHLKNLGQYWGFTEPLYSQGWISGDFHIATGDGSAFPTQTSLMGKMAVSSTGPPSTGSYSPGDFGFDGNGTLWYCVIGGSPGTWYPTSCFRFASVSPVAVPSFTQTIPKGFRSLQIIWRAQDTGGLGVGSFGQVTVNGDSSPSYYGEDFFSINTQSGTSTSGANSMNLFVTSGGAQGGGVFNSGVIWSPFLGAQTGTIFPSFLSMYHQDNGGTNQLSRMSTWHYANSSYGSVNSLTFVSTALFNAGSVFDFYGYA